MEIEKSYLQRQSLNSIELLTIESINPFYRFVTSVFQVSSVISLFNSIMRVCCNLATYRLRVSIHYLENYSDRPLISVYTTLFKTLRLYFCTGDIFITMGIWFHYSDVSCEFYICFVHYFEPKSILELMYVSTNKFGEWSVH